MPVERYLRQEEAFQTSSYMKIQRKKRGGNYDRRLFFEMDSAMPIVVDYRAP